MVESVYDVLDVCKNTNSKMYDRLSMLMEKKIPLTGFQANLLTLNRGYGKTYVSYFKVIFNVIDMLEERDFVTVGEVGSSIYAFSFDPDCDMENRKIQWIYGFCNIVNKYFPELYIDKYKIRNKQVTISKKGIDTTTIQATDETMERSYFKSSKRRINEI